MEKEIELQIKPEKLDGKSYEINFQSCIKTVLEDFAFLVKRITVLSLFSFEKFNLPVGLETSPLSRILEDKHVIRYPVLNVIY